MSATVRKPARSRNQLVSSADQIAAGKILRKKIPRERLGTWKPAGNRSNPLDILRESDGDRHRDLIPIRYGRMLESPFAFYRGSASVMAADLARLPSSGLTVQACGDCHLMNFGGFATPERNLIFDINDFDETLPAPWDWDVRRLVASVVLAGRSIGLSERKSRDRAITCARSYRQRMREFAEMDPLELWYSVISVGDVMGVLSKSDRKRLQKRIDKATAPKGDKGVDLSFPTTTGSVGARNARIKDEPPLIFHPEDAAAAEFEADVRDGFKSYREALNEDRRALLDRYRVVDAVMKVVGVGSVGRRCWIALLMSADSDPLLLQFKEAGPSVLEPFNGKSACSHHGQRVVLGQRLMQPATDIFLGWVTGTHGREMYVRQLRDAKIRPPVETFDENLLDVYAGLCGWVLARGHAKASDISGTISGYLGASSDKFDDAMGKFAVAYADQAEQDHALLKAAVRAGKIEVVQVD